MEQREDGYLPDAVAHCPNRLLELRPAEILFASASALRGLLVFRARPYLPLPGPDNPWLPDDRLPDAGTAPEDRRNFSLLVSLEVRWAEGDAKEPVSLAECNPFKVESPADGIFLFFLLFVFSNESYPSTEEAAESGCWILDCLIPSGLGGIRPGRRRISGGDRGM
jgi:hypothetical protein